MWIIMWCCRFSKEMDGNRWPFLDPLCLSYSNRKKKTKKLQAKLWCLAHGYIRPGKIADVGIVKMRQRVKKVSSGQHFLSTLFPSTAFSPLSLWVEVMWNQLSISLHPPLFLCFFLFSFFCWFTRSAVHQSSWRGISERIAQPIRALSPFSNHPDRKKNFDFSFSES